MLSERETVLKDIEDNKADLREVKEELGNMSDPARREKLENRRDRLEARREKLEYRRDRLEETIGTLEKRALALTPMPAEAIKTFAIGPVQPGSVVLQEYIDTGNRLKTSTSSGMTMIEAGLTKFVAAVKECTTNRAATFAYLDGSSGLGKTQLAFALQRKVLYIPQGNSQEVYKCFDGLCVAVNKAIMIDQQALRIANDTYGFGSGIGDFTAEYINEAVDEGGDFRFFTVRLLLRMLELFHSPPADASYNTNVFLGADVTEKLESMTLRDGRKAAEKYRDTLIHIDEVPMLNSGAQDPFLRCLLLRNIICHMGMPCLLSGTESTLLDVVNLGKGSRREGSEPWAWLLTRFPVTELDEQLTELTERCKPYESHLLRSTRPLFVQWFARCHYDGLTETDGAERIRMTPTTLTGVKHKMCAAKLLLPEGTVDLKENGELSWLHASTLMVFADSLRGSGAVTSTVSIESTAQVGTKRSASPTRPSALRKKQKIADDVYHHTLLIRNHFALLHIPHDLVSENGMIQLHVEFNTGVCDGNGKLFTAKAVFKTCTEDPLLYLAGLRDGLVRRDDARRFVSVPSSYAFATFREQRGIGNHLAKSNDGTALEAECMAALVLASHRYESFAGTPFFTWLALVVAELSFERDFNVTEIIDIPEELAAALTDVMVPLLSPPNSEWGQSVYSDINFGNFAWCKNQERRDASAPLSNTTAAGSTQGEGEETGEDLENEGGLLQFAQETHGYTSLGAEFKDANGFGGENMAAVTTQVAENSVRLLIGRDLCDWKEDTVQKFARDVSVYRMNKSGSIVPVSPQVADWKAGRKVLIALDLKQLHPGRSKALPHATEVCVQ